jgi:peptide/nickel transport system ATP-binding protein
VQRQAVLAPAATRPSAWQERVADEDAVLAVSGVSASYGSTRVLHDVDLTVRKGTCLALVGESGSGKTTNPLASLNPRHTLSRIIAAPLVTFGLADSARQRRLRVRELLERVALPAQYEHRYPSQLSGGERQRVAIARALAAQPRLLICDEITSALDVSIQASILQLLGGLREDEHLTMIFITHHIGLVRAIADDLVILRHGRVVERGAASQVLDQPTDAYAIELLANTPQMSESPAQAS